MAIVNNKHGCYPVEHNPHQGKDRDARASKQASAALPIVQAMFQS
jgi:hypothetical protein